MPNHFIFWPMLAVLAIPIFVLFLNALRKQIERSKGNVHEDAPIDNSAWPLAVRLTSNSLANQFQLPVIFYVLCFILLYLNGVTILVLLLSWAFAVSRWFHAIVHVTTNIIVWRLLSFLVGCVTLLILFVITIITLAQYSV